MYLGDLGQQGTTKVIRSQRGERPNCPSGWQVMGRHGSGIRESVECYLPQQFAPPPVTNVSYEAPRTTVSVPTAVSTQVSPQISPTLAQQQASPGAGVTGAPAQSMPGGVSASPSTGISAGDLQRILEAQEAARAAEREAAERKTTAEMEELRRQMAERERASQDIYLAEQKAAADRAEAERFASEQAEALAAQAAPPPSSMTYAPSGGGGMPAMSIPQTQAIDAGVTPQARDVNVTADAGGQPPWALILLAAAGVGAVVLMGGKKSRRKSRAKK